MRFLIVIFSSLLALSLASEFESIPLDHASPCINEKTEEFGTCLTYSQCLTMKGTPMAFCRNRFTSGRCCNFLKHDSENPEEAEVEATNDDDVEGSE